MIIGASVVALATSGTAFDVTLSADGNTAFVADGSSGLQIIDISNPASPTLTATLATSGNARGVTLSADGDTAFVADRSSGLQIIAVSNTQSFSSDSVIAIIDVFDSTPPTFVSAATSTDGTKVVLTYNETLSSTTATASDFAVTTDSAANAVTAIAISGSTVELTLTNTVKNDQTVTVAYTDPSNADDTNAVQDSAGNDAASLTSTSVTNNSTVDVPVITGASSTLAFTEGDGASVIDSSLSITDSDDTNFESAIVTISSGFQSAEDVLAFTNGNGITGSWNASTGVLTLSGTS